MPAKKDFSKEPKQTHQPGKENKMDPRPEYIKKTYKASGKLTGKKSSDHWRRQWHWSRRRDTLC